MVTVCCPSHFYPVVSESGVGSKSAEVSPVLQFVACTWVSLYCCSSLLLLTSASHIGSLTGLYTIELYVRHTQTSCFNWVPNPPKPNGRTRDKSSSLPRPRDYNLKKVIRTLNVTEVVKVCVLPPRYDFCVSYPALVAGMDTPEFQEVPFSLNGDRRVDRGGCKGVLLRSLTLENPQPQGRKPDTQLP